MTHFITLFLMSIGVLFTNPKVGDSFQIMNSDQVSITTNDASTIPPSDGGNKDWEDE